MTPSRPAFLNCLHGVTADTYSSLTPTPISTAGFDAAPFLTATCVITRDPDTGVQNMGTYRAQLKSPDRLGLMMFTGMRQGGFEHWKKYQARREKVLRRAQNEAAAAKAEQQLLSKPSEGAERSEGSPRVDARRPYHAHSR